MLAGRLPFRSDYEQAVIYSILNEKEVSLTKLRPDVPGELERTISKALAKSADERYERVDEMLADLRSAKKKGEFKEKRPAQGALGIAVLPFINIRNDLQIDFLGFALADQIIGSLSYVGNILVRPSSAIRRYQTQMVDAQTAGRELQVEFILTGNFLKEADIARLNVELVNVQSNSILWREPIHVKYENTFSLQDLVSEKVIKGLQVQLSQDERNRMQADIPKDPLAYEYYLRAVSYPVTIEGDELAIEMLKKSVGLDATYAPAFSELGFRIYQLKASAMQGREKSIEAEQAFRKALSLNENLLTALWNLSLHYTEIGNSEEAFKLIEQMFRITPNNALAHYALGYLYRYVGMLEESAQEVERALALDAKNPKFRSAAFTYVYLGNYKKAYEVFDLDRESTLSCAWKGMALFLQGQGERAIEYFDRAVAMEPKGYIGLRHAGIRAFLKGERNEGLRAIRQLEEANPSDSDSEHWYLIGNAYALLGDKGGCFRGLRKAIEGGFFNYPGLMKDPLLDSVRRDPEFQRLLAMAKGKHEAFKTKFFPHQP
jgi:TolB-like protein/Tfp pilus assembly protein PilF